MNKKDIEMRNNRKILIEKKRKEKGKRTKNATIQGRSRLEWRRNRKATDADI